MSISSHSMHNWAKLPLEKKASLLTELCQEFQQSSLYLQSIRYYEKEVFRIKRCQYILSQPFSKLTQTALLDYTEKDCILTHHRKVLLLLGGKIPNPFLFTLFQGLMANVYFIVKPSFLDPLFPCLLQKAFRTYLPRYRIWETISERGETLLKKPISADGVMMFGSNRSISFWQSKAKKAKIPFIAYGERISGGIVLGQKETPYEKLSEDILLYHQEGCFSPHFFFFIGKKGKQFARDLFEAMKASLKIFPTPHLNKREKNQMFFTLHHYRALHTLSKDISLFCHPNANVIFSSSFIEPRFIGLCTVYVYQVPSLKKAEQLCQHLSHPISTLIVYPEHLKKHTTSLAFRIVSPGNAHQNSVSDLHENRAWITEMFHTPSYGRKVRKS